MYARSTTIQGQPSSIDAGIAHTRDSAMPALEAIDGCGGLAPLGDRTPGRRVVTTSWESQDAMPASEESIRPIRDRAAELLGGSRQVEEWETASKRWSGTRTSWTGSELRAVRKHTQRCSTSATSSWRLHTCVCPRWSDRLHAPRPGQIRSPLAARLRTP